jgi:uracil-DNA glycosylase
VERVKLEASWKQLLQAQFELPYMHELSNFLRQQKQAGKQIFPAGGDIFNALNSTPVDKVKLVILGQDPYHGDGQAHGLCFSVRPGTPIPPSLKNIYKELRNDLGIIPAHSGCLQSWAAQGVLLLNAVLTVEAGQAGSHQGRGWELFTDSVVTLLNARREHLVFLLWGSYAQRKGAMIDRERHLVLESPHPSPLSASRGFFGNQHFSRANAYLLQHGMTAIDWQVREQEDSDGGC